MGKRWLSDYEIDRCSTLLMMCMTIQLVLSVSQPIFCTHLVGYMKKFKVSYKKASRFQE